MEALTKQQIQNIFNQIDKDHDGFINRPDIEATNYAASLLNSNQMALNSFNSLPQQRMNLSHFIQIVYGVKYNLVDFVVAKYNAEKSLNKYLLVSAPGGAPPQIKQSYLKFKAHGSQQKQVLHSLGVQFGVDKPHQFQKIKQVTAVLGHPPHEVFIMLKIKTNSNGQQIAQKLNNLVNVLLELVSGFAQEFEQIFKGLRINTRFANGYVYLIIEIDNPLVDTLVDFMTKVLESVSPDCAFKFKANISSNLSNLLSKDFDYTKSGGEVCLEFDIDHFTLKKVKEIMGDNVSEYEPVTPENQIFSLLFQELKVEAEFNNLAEALTSAFMIDVNQLPKPADNLDAIKEMGIKENLEQFTEGGPNVLALLNQNCQAEGELSLNLHDVFLKLSFDIHIKNAFDVLG